MYIYTIFVKKYFLYIFVFMATRIDDLEEFVKKQAEELVARLGSQKQVLSAGILALYDLDDKTRSDYMAKAVGKNKTQDNSVAESIEIVKHFIRYKIPNDEERRLLESLRQLLADDSAAQAAAGKQKRKKNQRGSKEGG